MKDKSRTSMRLERVIRILDRLVFEHGPFQEKIIKRIGRIPTQISNKSKAELVLCLAGLIAKENLIKLLQKAGIDINEMVRKFIQKEGIKDRKFFQEAVDAFGKIDLYIIGEDWGQYVEKLLPKQDKNSQWEREKLLLIEVAAHEVRHRVQERLKITPFLWRDKERTKSILLKKIIEEGEIEAMKRMFIFFSANLWKFWLFGKIIKMGTEELDALIIGKLATKKWQETKDLRMVAEIVKADAQKLLEKPEI